MRIEDYPPQEPLSEVGQAFADEVMRRAETVEGIEHFYGDDPYQGITVHAPANPNGTVLAFVHGGGWTSGYKEHLDFMAPAFVEAGVVFATIGYRLAPQHSFPVGLEDVANGIAWLHRHAGEFGGDPSRIFIGGHSAGGHYTALLAVRCDWQAAHNLPESVVRGCLPISGVYLFGEGSGLSARPRFLGPEENDVPASPIQNINATPPFLIAHGSEDFPHLMAQAGSMERALADAGGEVERLVLDGRNHFSACYAGGEADGPWVPRALAWMAAH
jgi:acetyl esterase/lipase